MHFSLFGCCQGALKFATASAITASSSHGSAFPILQAVVLARRIHNAIGHLGIILLEAQLAATPKPVME